MQRPVFLQGRVSRISLVTSASKGLPLWTDFSAVAEQFEVAAPTEAFAVLNLPLEPGAPYSVKVDTLRFGNTALPPKTACDIRFGRVDAFEASIALSFVACILDVLACVGIGFSNVAPLIAAFT